MERTKKQCRNLLNKESAKDITKRNVELDIKRSSTKWTSRSKWNQKQILKQKQKQNKTKQKLKLKFELSYSKK